MIRQIADEVTFSDILYQRMGQVNCSSTGGHFDRISETQYSMINDINVNKFFKNSAKHWDTVSDII